MSFRVYCYHCKSQLTPPIWAVGSLTFCNPQCQKDAIEAKKKAELDAEVKNECERLAQLATKPRCN